MVDKNYLAALPDRGGRITVESVAECVWNQWQNDRGICIIAAGIKRVVYVEPYPKSKALEFHSDSISLRTKLDEDSGDEQVTFEPFTGVGARRFIDFFSMSLGTGNKLKRKNKDGSILEWKKQDAIIRVKLIPESYINIESAAASIFDLKNQS